MSDTPPQTPPTSPQTPPKELRCLPYARALVRAGVSVLPIKPGEKKPAIPSWKIYETEIADNDLLAHWFSNGNGLAYIMGKVSGNAELIDFDHISLYALFGEACKDNGLGGLLDDLCVLQTPSGGHHLVYRTEATVCGNKKLARSQDGTTLIETRGEGGYALTFPTPGYKILHGKPTELSVLTVEQRKALHQVAGLFNDYESPASQKTERESTPGNSPGDDYNQRGDYEAVLERHGWRRLHRHGERQTWTRPNHEEAVLSGTTGYQGARMLYVFSTNALPFESERKYSPFAVYTFLEHGTDEDAFRKAAAALGKEGYGEQGGEHKARTRKKKEEESKTESPDTNDDQPNGEMSEWELAQAWARRVENQFLFVEGEQWWEYSENHWQYSSEAKASRSVMLFLEATGKVTPTRVRNVLYMASRLLGPIDMASFDSRSDWIPLANGVYELSTGNLLPHDPLHRLTHISPYEYNADADCPLWKECMNDWMIKEDGSPCPEWRDIIQEFMGYCLIPDTKAQVAMMWCGRGENGKGSTTRVLQALVGKGSWTTIPIEMLHDPYHRAEIHSRLIGFVDEPDSRAMQKNGNWFKAIVGGDPISARRPTERVFTFSPTVRIIISTNELPTTKDTSHGYYRRLIMIDWRYQVPAEKRDNDLDPKLVAELPGIFNWAVEGLRRYRERRKFLIPEESMQLLEHYKRSQDETGRFFEEELIFEKAAMTASSDLYATYRKWAESAGMKPDTEQMFGRRLTQRRCVRDRDYIPVEDGEGNKVMKQARVWKGVRLRVTADDKKEEEERKKRDEEAKYDG